MSDETTTIDDPNGMPGLPWSAAARDAAMRWLARGRQGRRKCVMSPMDEMMWFQPHDEDVTLITLGDPTIQIIDPDPMRVSLSFAVHSFSDPNSAPWAYVLTLGPNTFAAGFVLSQTTLYLHISSEEWPSIVQAGWSCHLNGDTSTNNGRVNVHTCELSLRDWPQHYYREAR